MDPLRRYSIGAYNVVDSGRFEAELLLDLGRSVPFLDLRMALGVTLAEQRFYLRLEVEVLAMMLDHGDVGVLQDLVRPEGDRPYFSATSFTVV